MKTRSPRIVLAAAVTVTVLGTAACGTAGSGGSQAVQGGKSQLAVVMSNMQDPYWQTVQCGMKKAAQEFASDIDVKYYTTPTYDSAGIQSSFDAAKLTNPNGMFLQVVQPTQLVAQTQGYMQKGIPVVGASAQQPNQLYDVLGADFSSAPLVQDFISSIPKNGKVATIGGQSTVSQVTVRYQPLLDALKQQRPDVTVLQVEYTDFDVTKATRIASALFVGNPDLTTIIGSNGPDASGVLAAMKQSKMKPGAVDFWAWDSTPETIQGLRDGYISHLSAQGALAKGYDAIKELRATIQSNPDHKALTPKPESDWYSPPLGRLTKANIDAPENKQYLAIPSSDCPYN